MMMHCLEEAYYGMNYPRKKDLWIVNILKVNLGKNDSC